MSGIVYLLCAATSFLCTMLLFRGYLQSRVRLLFWSGLCFGGFVIDNILLYVDLEMVPSIDISIWRRIPALVALMLLVYGLIWESN